MKPYLKASWSGAIAFLSVVSAGLTDSNLTMAEWVAAALGALVAAGGVYNIPYQPKP